MPFCPNCDTSYYRYCLACELRREELLRRLQPDNRIVSIAVVAGWALFDRTETRERVWRVG
jgi:hypothetical protein